MRNLFKISFIVLFFANKLFANPFIEPLEKVAELLDDGIVQAIAVLLLAVCGFYVSSGNFEKGKVYAWGLIIGTSVVFGANYIVNFIWG
jgi:type IV secretory pathway VirB2 component (pilin)